ncbi:hypothetical protein KQX54_020249 [Cotesia glomerata]|uniref:Uncharacterized protein n=1 Tax=Cotesia glomerata TaxID=32391 RepID=A0AAV7IRP9_COTGL|nr:hypothetical protein KQX54_020249 [Cotesia glomerata]
MLESSNRHVSTSAEGLLLIGSEKAAQEKKAKWWIDWVIPAATDGQTRSSWTSCQQGLWFPMLSQAEYFNET